MRTVRLLQKCLSDDPLVAHTRAAYGGPVADCRAASGADGLGAAMAWR